MGHEIVSAAERTGTARLFVDGLDALHGAVSPDRLPAFWAALSQEMRSRGVTVLASAQAGLAGSPEASPSIPGIAETADVVVVLARVERAAAAPERVLRVAKSRGRRHDPRSVRYEVTHSGIRIGRRFGEDGAPRGAAGGRRSAREGSGPRSR